MGSCWEPVRKHGLDYYERALADAPPKLPLDYVAESLRSCITREHALADRDLYGNALLGGLARMESRLVSSPHSFLDR